MDLIRAKDIIASLANGINPITGEYLPQSDSCNQPEVIRALYVLLNSIQDNKIRPQPENAGKPWTKDDDNLLCQMFDEGKSNKELSNHFKRTVGAITSRLVRLGKIVEKNYDNL